MLAFDFQSQPVNSRSSAELEAEQAGLSAKIADFLSAGGSVQKVDNFGNAVGEYRPEVESIIQPVLAPVVSVADPVPVQPTQEIEPVDDFYVIPPPPKNLSFKDLCKMFEAKVSKPPRSAIGELRSINREAAKLSKKLDAIEARLCGRW